MYRVRLSQGAAETYDGLQDRDRRKVNRGIDLIGVEPFYAPGKIIPLSGVLKGKHRCKIPPWRIIYEINRRAREVLVLTIERRSESTYG